MIPKIIWIYWETGHDSMNELTRFCVSTWQKYNPEWEVRVVDKSSLKTYLNMDQWVSEVLVDNVSLLTPTNTSDVIRIKLLSKYGGIYVDADVLCCKPVDEWIHSAVRESGFFAFCLPGTRRTISSWFLAAVTGNYLCNMYCQYVDKYWKSPIKKLHYYWFHYMFKPMLDSDAEVRKIWSMCNKHNASGRLYFRNYRRYDSKKYIDDGLTNNWKDRWVYKLNRKRGNDSYLLDQLKELV